MGPDRKVVEYKTETYDVGVWARDEKYACECKKPDGTCANACIVCEWQRTPGQACGDATYSYKTGEVTEVVEKVTYLPEATISGTLQNCSAQNGWCTQMPFLHLTGAEPLAGESITFLEGTRNGENFLCSGSACDLPLSEGENTFSFWALSTYGDSSQMGNLSAKVDTRAPQISANANHPANAQNWFHQPVSLTASASDPTPGSGVDTLEYALDNANWTAYSAPLDFNDGIQTLYLRASDRAGNSTNWSMEIKVDSQIPQISQQISGTPGENNWYISETIVELANSDPAPSSGIASFETSLDGTNWDAYGAPLRLLDGVYGVQVRVMDVAGNQAQNAFALQIDTTPPEISGTLLGTRANADWFLSQAELNTADATSGIASQEVSIDGGGWQNYGAPVVFTEGIHTIQFRSTDNAGLQSETAVLAVNIDSTPPRIDLPSRWYIWESGNFSVRDNLGKITAVGYKISDSLGRVEENWTPYSAEFSRSISWNRLFENGILAPIGSYTVTVYAEDESGNRSQKSAQIIIPQPQATALPTFTATPTASNTPVTTPTATAYSAPPILPQATATPYIFNTPIPIPTEEESDGVFSFFSPPADTPSAPENDPASNILWGTGAAAALGIYNAKAEERRRKRREAEAKSRAEAEKKADKINGVERIDQHQARLDAKRRAHQAEMRAEKESKEKHQRVLEEKRKANHEPRLSYKEKEHRAELQAIWDANGAVIYEANKAFKAEHGHEMDAETRQKLIAEATTGGVFDVNAYAVGLRQVEQEKEEQAARIRAAANEMEEEKKIGYEDPEARRAQAQALADWKREDMRATDKAVEEQKYREALYDGRKDGESALSRLIYKFQIGHKNETALERMKKVLQETDTGPYTNFRNIPLGDTGFAREYQDGTIWPELPDFENQPGQQGSDNQVGHFLTAVNLSIQVQEKPWYIRWVYKKVFLSAIIGHELIGDDFGGKLNETFPISPSIQILIGLSGGNYARNLFLSGNEQQLEELFLRGGKPGVGNSLEDLRLSYQGWVSGEKLVNGEFDTPKDYAEWLEENLR